MTIHVRPRTWLSASLSCLNFSTNYNLSVPDPINQPQDLPPSSFATTRWSMIQRLGGSEDSGRKDEALAELCHGYWFPLYAYVRRSGKSPEDAEDITQSYFAHLLTKAKFDRLSPDQGLFRSYLLKTLKRFMIDQIRKETAEKRGGKERPLSLDIDAFEERLAIGPGPVNDAERSYDRDWAVALVDRVLASLGEAYGKAGKGELFNHLKECLVGQADRTYAEKGAEIGMSEDGFSMAVHRARRRFGEELREEIAQTVSDPSEVDDELRWLLSVLGGTVG